MQSEDVSEDMRKAFFRAMAWKLLDESGVELGRILLLLCLMTKRKINVLFLIYIDITHYSGSTSAKERPAFSEVAEQLEEAILATTPRQSGLESGRFFTDIVLLFFVDQESATQ
jgi:hypothetical protein